MGNILVNKLYSRRLYAIVTAVIFLPTRRLGFMGLLAALLVIGVGLSYFFLFPVALGIFILSIAADYFYSDQKVKLSKLLMSSLLFAASLSAVQGAFIC